MTRNVRSLRTAAVIVCLVAVGSYDIGAQGPGMPPAAVIVSEVLEERIATDVSLVGTVQPRRRSMVASETEGKVAAVVCEAGQSLRTGDVIMRLKNDQLRASLAEALADVKLHKFNYEQSSKLLRQEAVAEQALRDSEYELDRARAKLSDLRSRLEGLEIRAPFSGLVVQTLAELGEWVGRGDEVAHVISIDTIRVQVDAPERHVDRLRLGDVADIYIEALGAEPYLGRIVAIIAQGYPESHTFPVIVETHNRERRIRGGMAARVAFSVEQPDSVVLVHKDALVTQPQGKLVYLALDEKAAARPVKTGLAYKGYVAVEGNLKAGDLVIVRGNERLMDGRSIQVVRKQER